jgi:hypothetical protein
VFLVLARPSDSTAIDVAAALKRRLGSAQVQLRTPNEVVLAPRWEHRVCDHGTSTRILTHDGVTLEKPSVIFNRLSGFDSAPLDDGTPEDREYARAEIAALLLSWLAGVGCPVVNRPSPSSVFGGYRRAIVWQRLAVSAGLETVPLHATSSSRRLPIPGLLSEPQVGGSTSETGGRFRVNQFYWHVPPAGVADKSIHVIGKRVIGDAPSAILEGCVELARLAAMDFLRVDFLKSTGQRHAWAFAGADHWPVVSDAQVIAAVADLLETLAGARRSRATA